MVYNQSLILNKGREMPTEIKFPSTQKHEACSAYREYLDGQGGNCSFPPEHGPTVDGYMHWFNTPDDALPFLTKRGISFESVR
jgi:hypothetical protein